MYELMPSPSGNAVGGTGVAAPRTVANVLERRAYHRHLKRPWLWGLLIVVGLTAVVVRRAYWPTPTEALQDFYEYGLGADDGVTEDMLMDPLILGGDGVVPRVLAALPSKDMPRRRYAMAFLGNGAYRDALPVLRRILTDENELDIFRGDALQAICQIDAAEGKQTAPRFVSRGDYLGSTANTIAQQGCDTERRTPEQAARGCHDCVD